MTLPVAHGNSLLCHLFQNLLGEHVKNPVTNIIPFNWTPKGPVVAFSERAQHNRWSLQSTMLGQVEKEEFLSFLYHVTYIMELIFMLIFVESDRRCPPEGFV